MTQVPQSPCRRLARAAAVVLALASLAGAAPAAGADARIEKFEIQGNEFISLEAFLALTDLEVGDAYDEQAIQREFWKIWEHGLFEDLRIEAADGPGGGKVVIFTVREKPRVDTVTFEPVKGVTQARLDEVFRENDAEILPGSALDQEKVSRTRRILEEVLAAEGHPDARVTVVQRRVARSRVALDFKVDPGPRIKIGDITFTGNKVFSERELKGFLEQTKAHGLLSFMSDKTVFFRPRLEEDLEVVRKAYRAKGYLRASIGEPVLRDAKPGKSGKEERRFVTVVVPIEEGDRFTLGKLTISGNSVFATSELRALIPLAEGEILNDSLLRLGISRMDNRYGDAGHLYAVSSPRYVENEQTRVADVDVQVTEADKYTLRHLEFDGNTRTKDEVLRRELRLQEGDVWSRQDFQVGLRKIAQLGYWELDGEPTITPVPGDAKEVDVTIKGKEVGRNEVQFGGGFSGVDGFFATFSFQSRNFLGRGSAFSISGQIGGETTRYAVSYVEPYFMNTRSTVGGSIFARDQNFDGFDREGRGGSVFWSHPTSTFSFVRATARWEESKILADSGTTSVQDDEFTIYSLTPAWIFDNRDNPFRPTRGRRFSTAVEVGASKDEDPDFLGTPFDQGTVNFIKPEVSLTQYWRTHRRQYVGLHVEAGLLEPLTGGGDDPFLSDGIEPPFLPVFERYFLGGEQSIRGVETRSVGPRLRQVRAGIPIESDLAIGGDAYFLVNVEYNFPLNNLFEIGTFLDLGNSFGVSHLDVGDLINEIDSDVITIEDSDPFDVKATAGIEMRFHTPVLQQPLRLIYGCKVFGDFFDDEGRCDFQFSIGRTFQ